MDLSCLGRTIYARPDLRWWMDNIETTSKPIHQSKPHIVIQSDASLSAWGSVHGTTRTGGEWSAAESTWHINCLEILAAQFALQGLCIPRSGVHIQIQVDNTTAMAYINRMGGTKYQCNELTRQIWDWAIARNIWLSTSYVPSVHNAEADRQSQMSHENTEWKLNPCIVHQLVYGNSGYRHICIEAKSPAPDLHIMETGLGGCVCGCFQCAMGL